MQRFALLAMFVLVSGLAVTPAHADWTLYDYTWTTVSQGGDGGTHGTLSVSCLSAVNDGGGDGDYIQGNGNALFHWTGPNPPSETNPATVTATYTGHVFGAVGNIGFDDRFELTSSLNNWLGESLDSKSQRTSYYLEGSFVAQFPTYNTNLEVGQGFFASTMVDKRTGGSGAANSSADVSISAN